MRGVKLREGSLLDFRSGRDIALGLIGPGSSREGRLKAEA